uniref:Ig-like domain-containing protein n=1 Tax=Astyanax mexicanus TaxID=7994 RepID=A0A3B1J501_ASTMX
VTLLLNTLIFCDCHLFVKRSTKDAPLVVEVDEDLVLPCSLHPNISAANMTVEWSRTDLYETDNLVHVFMDYGDINDNQRQSYRGRTALFKEELQRGNTSLKLSAVQPSDEGAYKCFTSRKPLGVAMRKYSGTKRLIIDLSAPHGTPVPSINSLVPSDLFSLCYARVDDAISLIKIVGRGAWMAKADVVSAFKVLPLHPDFWHLFCVRWRGLFVIFKTLNILHRCISCSQCIIQFFSILCYVLFMTERFKVVGPDAPLVVEVDEDLVLPCSLHPNISAVDMTVEWTRTDLYQTEKLVHLYEGYEATYDNQRQSYRGRTALFKEELQRGNTSLKLSAVQPSDEGAYKCFVRDSMTSSELTVV